MKREEVIANPDTDLKVTFFNLSVKVYLIRITRRSDQTFIVHHQSYYNSHFFSLPGISIKYPSCNQMFQLIQKIYIVHFLFSLKAYLILDCVVGKKRSRRFWQSNIEKWLITGYDYGIPFDIRKLSELANNAVEKKHETEWIGRLRDWKIGQFSNDTWRLLELRYVSLSFSRQVLWFFPWTNPSSCKRARNRCARPLLFVFFGGGHALYRKRTVRFVKRENNRCSDSPGRLIYLRSR